MTTPDEDGVEICRITIARSLAPDGALVDTVDTAAAQGALSLTEALGMLRLAEDTLIRRAMGEEPPDE